jgi:hypothetical protein
MRLPDRYALPTEHAATYLPTEALHSVSARDNGSVSPGSSPWVCSICYYECISTAARSHTNSPVLEAAS